MRIVGWLGDVDFDIIKLGDLLVATYQVEVRSSHLNGALTPVGFAPAAVSLSASYFSRGKCVQTHGMVGLYGSVPTPTISTFHSAISAPR
jgi:hypothetical protein